MSRLIILGASARAAAYSAARAGFEPYAIDLFADADLAAFCPAVRIDRYPRGFLRALANSPKAPWMYTGGLENHPRLIARMAALRPLLGNGPDLLRAVRDPRRLAGVLAEEGFAAPRLFSGEDGDRFRWLIKPLRGSAGLGVRFAMPRELAALPRGVVLQEYIAGESCSATFVAAGARAVLLGASRQLIGRDVGLASEFLYAGSLAPLELRPDELAKLARLGDALARRFHLVGLFGVDFVRTAAELWPIEVNPRYTASIEVIERVTGLASVALHAAAFDLGTLPAHPPLANGFAGKAVVYARENCRWKKGSGFICADRGTQEMKPDPFCDVPQPQQAFLAGQPIVTVFAEGGSLGDVERQLRARADDVLAQFVEPLG